MSMNRGLIFRILDSFLEIGNHKIRPNLLDPCESGGIGRRAGLRILKTRYFGNGGESLISRYLPFFIEQTL
jgi:hypothetical protein